MKNKIAIVTDSNSGITQSQAKELGISVLPMPFYINDELFYEDLTLTQEEFYQKLEEDANISAPPSHLQQMSWSCGKNFWKRMRKLCIFPCPVV